MMNGNFKFNQAVEIDSYFRLQMPDEMAPFDFGDAKLMDPLFFVPPLSAAQFSHHLATAQYSKKRELSSDSQHSEEPAPKKSRGPDDGTVLDFKDPHPARFRDYQAGQWTEKFEELCQFVKKNSHCLVPNSFNENPPLAHWTKRQRYQYKLKAEGKPSTMTDDRILALNALGFIWNAHEAGWEERFNELVKFKAEQGHCNVPSLHKGNQKLATWVKCARRQYKLLVAGKKSNMTLERATRLANVGFVWELRPQILR